MAQEKMAPEKMAQGINGTGKKRLHNIARKKWHNFICNSLYTTEFINFLIKNRIIRIYRWKSYYTKYQTKKNG